MLQWFAPDSLKVARIHAKVIVEDPWFAAMVTELIASMV